MRAMCYRRLAVSLFGIDQLIRQLTTLYRWAPADSLASKRQSLTCSLDETPSLTRSHQRDLATRLDRLEQIIANPTATEQEMSFQNPNPSQPDQTTSAKHSLNPPNPGHLSLPAHSRAIYASPTFFALIRREVNEINDLLRGQQGFELTHIRNCPSEGEEVSEPRTTAKTRGSGSFGQGSASQLYPETPTFLSSGMFSERHTTHVDARQLTDALPARAGCEVLLDAYMAGYHTISPMIHGPSVRQGISSLLDR